MKVHTLKLGLNRTNTYIIEKENKCLLIDCPSDSAEDIKQINEITKNKQVLAIIYTHNHFDHIGGGYKFDIPQFMHKNDLNTINTQIKLAEVFNYSKINIPKIKPLTQIPKEIIDLFKFKIIEIPGHTKGGISILFKQEKIIFTGDTLFKGTFGRTDIGGDEEEMKKSLKKLLKLDENIIVYPGHGHKSTIEEERKSLSKYLNDN